MPKPPSVTNRTDWESARTDLLEREKAHMRAGDELARARREMPWVRVDERYAFATEHGPAALTDLFGEHDQLVVYHFMYDPSWSEGCVSCSFWADNFDGIDAHLADRNVSFVVASAAPLDQLLAYRGRMGWTFEWVSAAGTTFNRDFEVAGSTRYNYRPTDEPIGESPGLSVFARHDGDVYHTYSTYARGLEAFNGAYHLLDLVPAGRDETDLPWTMAWLRRHDETDH